MGTRPDLSQAPEDLTDRQARGPTHLANFVTTAPLRHIYLDIKRFEALNSRGAITARRVSAGDHT